MSDKVQNAIAEIGTENLQAVLSIGIKEDGTTVLRSSENNLAIMHWMLNKAVFELNVYEANLKQQASEEE